MSLSCTQRLSLDFLVVRAGEKLDCHREIQLEVFSLISFGLFEENSVTSSHSLLKAFSQCSFLDRRL